jgi:hypothetical protein
MTALPLRPIRHQTSRYIRQPFLHQTQAVCRVQPFVMTSGTSWTEIVEAIGVILIPLVVAGLAYAFARNQSRSDELLKVRLDYYKILIVDLNRLMCYMTFIGSWRDISPVDVVKMKRRLDETFYCAAPLFSPDVMTAYDSLMGRTFKTFNNWGIDAKLLTSAYRRRQAWQAATGWRPIWDDYFELQDTATISEGDLRHYRETYDSLVALLVRDLDINRTRAQYTTDLVSLNAHAPMARSVAGSAG